MRWIAANKGPLPTRHGPRPRTTSTNPHLQIDQQPVNARIRESLTEQLFVLESVVECPSGISVPGARALCLEPSAAKGPPEAFMIGTEFAHLHPPPDLSLHLMLPEKLASDVVEAGWGELHLAAKAGVVPPTAVMLYAPRETEELAMVVGFAIESYRFARGEALPYTEGSAAVLDSEKYEREGLQWGRRSGWSGHGPECGQVDAPMGRMQSVY